MSGQLTTHVLDTAQGHPAAGLKIELWAMALNGQETLLKSVFTNMDGRTDGPLLEDQTFTVGVYELRFSVGDYFRAQEIVLPEPLFLNIVPIRFGIADAEGHYHVPLLCSPWSYSTYRGS